MNTPIKFRWTQKLLSLDERYEVASDGLKHTVSLENESITLVQVSQETLRSNVGIPTKGQLIMINHLRDVGLTPRGCGNAIGFLFKMRPLKAKIAA